jgi:gluconolactonase
LTNPTSRARTDLLFKDIHAANDIAFSPDEKTLYVSDVDPTRAAWLAYYDVTPDGTVTNGRMLFARHPLAQRSVLRAGRFKVNRQGHIFGALPDGLSVIATDGTLLSTIDTGQPTSNVA